MQRHIWVLTALALLASGCATVGPKSIRNSRFDYNQAIVDTRNEQLLTNLVRLRYRDPPHFLEVSSISTSYSLGAGADASIGDIGGADIASASAGVNYQESPTVTYLPLKGEAFVSRILAPLPMETIMLLTRSGWRVDRVLRCCVQRVNEVWNAPTASGLTPKVAPDFEKFSELANILEVLRQRGAMELRYRTVEEGEDVPVIPLEAGDTKYLLSLRFRPGLEVDALLDRLKEMLGLRQDLYEFYLTRNPTYRGPQEIGLVPRSLMGAMSYLAQSVQAPQRDLDQGRVMLTRNRDGSEFDWGLVTDGLLRVSSSDSAPDNAFVKVRYRGTWFYIDDSDLDSKSTFSLLDLLFQLQAGSASGAAPLLTLQVN